VGAHFGGVRQGPGRDPDKVTQLMEQTEAHECQRGSVGKEWLGSLAGLGAPLAEADG
jgi:hypothetical protein